MLAYVQLMRESVPVFQISLPSQDEGHDHAAEQCKSAGRALRNVGSLSPLSPRGQMPVSSIKVIFEGGVNYVASLEQS